MMKSLLMRAAAGCGAALICSAVAAQTATQATAAPKTRVDCERSYKPQVGQTGKDVVWVPTPDELVARMLGMAKVTPQDLVIDLGAGDGKIAIAAAKKYGAHSLGIEYNPEMAKLAQCMVQVEGVADKTKIIQGDIFKEDFSKANVLTMYLLPELNLCVRHRILAMKPGTRVASHQFTMADWEADETTEMDYRTAYLWIVPARVGGAWAFRQQGGGNPMQFNVNLNQNFQKLSGEAIAGANKQPLVGASLRGEDLKFAFNDDKGVTRSFTGTARGNEITGVLRASGQPDVQVTATPQGQRQATSWANMLSQCERFYK